MLGQARKARETCAPSCGRYTAPVELDEGSGSGDGAGLT